MRGRGVGACSRGGRSPWSRAPPPSAAAGCVSAAPPSPGRGNTGASSPAQPPGSYTQSQQLGEKGIKIFSFIINVVLLYHVFSRKKDF